MGLGPWICSIMVNNGGTLEFYTLVEQDFKPRQPHLLVRPWIQGRIVNQEMTSRNSGCLRQYLSRNKSHWFSSTPFITRAIQVINPHLGGRRQRHVRLAQRDWRPGLRVHWGVIQYSPENLPENCPQKWVLGTLCRTEIMKSICGHKINTFPTSSPQIPSILATNDPHPQFDNSLPRKLPTPCPHPHVLSLTSPHRNQHFIIISSTCQHNLFTIYQH